MASKNSYQQAGYYSTLRNNREELSLDKIDTCVDCGSRNLIETSEGFACRECGCVLELRALEHHAPYDDKTVQYSTLGTTQIGLKKERYSNANSIELQALQKLHSTKNYDEHVMQSARIEISRVLGCLNLPTSTNDFVFKKFKEIWAKLRKRTKYRSVDKLVPIVVYASMKLQSVSINEKDLLCVSKISKKEFNAFKPQLKEFIPQYAGRRRIDYILQKVLEISESFELSMNFYYLAKKILHQFWDTISQTKDDVIAGVVASIAAMCLDEYRVSVNSICKKLGIQMSAIQYQVKKNFFDRFRLHGFKSLVESANLLKKLLFKLNVVESETTQKAVEIVEVKLGSARQVRVNTREIHIVAFTDKDNKKMLAFFQESRKNTIFHRIVRKIQSNDNVKAITGKIYDRVSIISGTAKKVSSRYNMKLLELKILKYKNGKGPPS